MASLRRAVLPAAGIPPGSMQLNRSRVCLLLVPYTIIILLFCAQGDRSGFWRQADPVVAKGGIQFFLDERGGRYQAAMMFGKLPGITLRIENSLAYTIFTGLQKASIVLFRSFPFLGKKNHELLNISKPSCLILLSHEKNYFHSVSLFLNTDFRKVIMCCHRPPRINVVPFPLQHSTSLRREPQRGRPCPESAGPVPEHNRYSPGYKGCSR